ncbi:Beta-3 adrenergic receptor [Holothuria leucospilota]|uniref:Beta-3 adrenergic receptor n=1 Tax=Holothuria leucospilota TaxID=206669 RepID=A0A9Q1BPJ8_HOLLE|nr:Beta-3 adrenergic receptor [Holothuria leucospilota]
MDLDNVTAKDSFKQSSSVSTVVLIQFVIGFIGIGGNSLVCFVFLRDRNKRNQTNALITHQAFIDLLSSFLLVLLAGYQIIGSPSTESRVLQAFACFFWTRITLFAVFAVSTFNLTLISLERYIATVFPHSYAGAFTRKKIRRMILLVWIMAPVFQYFIAWTTHTYRDGKCIITKSPASVGILLFLWEYFLPVAIMSFSFFSVIRTLNILHLQVFDATSVGAMPSTTYPSQGQSTVNTVSSHGPSSSSQTNPNPQPEVSTVVSTAQVPRTANQAISQTIMRRKLRRRNATKALFLVYVVYVICWSPNQWAFFQRSLGGPLDFNGFFYQVSVVLAICNTAVNPFVYAFRHKTYQTRITEWLRSLIT